MEKLHPWLRTLLALPLGLVALAFFHFAVNAAAPQLYDAFVDDVDRMLSFALATVAGIVGSVVVGVIARHRLWLHMGIFMVIMLLIDLDAVRGVFGQEPAWFKVLLLASLPFQVWMGGVLASKLSRRMHGASP